MILPWLRPEVLTHLWLLTRHGRSSTLLGACLHHGVLKVKGAHPRWKSR